MDQINSIAVHFAIAVFCFAGSIFCAIGNAGALGFIFFILTAGVAALNCFLFMKQMLLFLRAAEGEQNCAQIPAATHPE